MYVHIYFKKIKYKYKLIYHTVYSTYICSVINNTLYLKLKTTEHVCGSTCVPHHMYEGTAVHHNIVFKFKTIPRVNYEIKYGSINVCTKNTLQY